MTARASAHRILGVDPSLRSTGYGVVEVRGADCVAVAHGVIDNRGRRSLSECLKRIHEGISHLMGDHRPQAVAVEGLVFVQNTRIAFTLGEVRGVILLAAAQQGVPVYEYAPRQVKQAVTGRGTAGKQQVAWMVKAQLGLAVVPGADAADALALALCHIHRRNPVAL